VFITSVSFVLHPDDPIPSPQVDTVVGSRKKRCNRCGEVLFRARPGWITRWHTDVLVNRISCLQHTWVVRRGYPAATAAAVAHATFHALWLQLGGQRAPTALAAAAAATVTAATKGRVIRGRRLL